MKKLLFVVLLVPLFILPSFGQEQKDRPTSYKDDLDLKWNQYADTVKLLAISKIHAPIEIRLFDRKTDQPLNSILLPAMDTALVLQYEGLDIATAKGRVGETRRIAYFFGHPDLSSPDTTYLYRLPFRKGKKYELSQGWNGKSSHRNESSRYALDFQLNVGEAVFAAREGVVVRAIDWFTKRGGPELRNAANRIVILHDDGTIASYVHLDYRGVLVREGERVSKGQKIGISGLTGFTRGPHLHFVVRKERDIAIPVYFEGYAGKRLKQGKRYKVR
jgi:hypothetical protein